MPPKLQHALASLASNDTMPPNGTGSLPTSAQVIASSTAPLSIVPEKAVMGHQIRSTVPSQYWGVSVASASAPDGALASSVSDPAPLPLLAGSGLSRPHLVLATQALKLPRRPSLPGLPSVCQGQGGLVLDRVVAHGSGDSWWAVLSGRARLGRLVAKRADLMAAAADPASYSLCATSRLQLSKNTVVRSRVDWCPPATSPIRASASATRDGGAGWAAPLSLSCQLRSRLGAGTEARADLAVGQRTASCCPPRSGAEQQHGEELEPGAEQLNHQQQPGAVTPLLLGLQAGTVAASRAPLVWRCGLLQVTAPPTLPLAGSDEGKDVAAAASSGNASMRSAVYVQGTAALQGERYLWQGPKKPLARRRRTDAGTSAAVAALGGGADAGAAAGVLSPPPPGLGPHNPVRKAASYVINRIGGGGTDGDDDNDDPTASASNVQPGRPTPASTAGSASATGAGSNATSRGGGAASGSGSGAAGGPPFNIELPAASQVQESLMDATQSISRLRDDVTQATQWLGGGGLVEQLAGDGARPQRPRPRAAESGPQAPWSSFIGEPHVKVAGVAGLTARAPVIMLTHGSAQVAELPPGPSASSLSTLLPLRLAWVQDLGLTRMLGLGRRGAPEEEHSGPAAHAASPALRPLSGGSLRPFASAAASVQGGRFSGWLLDFTRLAGQLDCGLWGPAIQAAGGAGTAAGSGPAQQRHPAFALGDTGAWHSLSLSLSQQLVGPLRFAADWRYELASSRPLSLPQLVAAPTQVGSGSKLAAAASGVVGAATWLPGAARGVAAHVSGMRPQLLEAVYALDLAVPGAKGAARVVAWYAPQRREGMIEIRMF